MSKQLSVSETNLLKDVSNDVKEFRQHSDFTFDISIIKQDVTELDNIIDNLDKTKDIDITDYIGKDKLEALIKENMKKLKESREKSSNAETITVNGKTITKADKVGNSRISRKSEESDIMKELKSEAKTEGIDVKELSNKVKEVIETLEKDAKQLEQEIDFTIKQPTKEEVENGRKYLFSTAIDSNFVTSQGIDTNKFIRHFTTFDNYNTKTQPKESLLDNAAKQLVYISRLSKYLGVNLLHETNLQLKFNNIDMQLCTYFKDKNINNYKVIYTILVEMFKKLIISSLSNVESAFRSQNCWIDSSFKNLILKDVIMLQSLPIKLAKSWEIFVTELCKTTDANIYNDISKLDYIIHINEDFIIEEILARSIKCMSPCFIYNYYQCVKSTYLLCGLLDDWFDRVSKDANKSEKVQQYYQEVVNITKVCLYIYENSRLYENSTARSLPYSKNPMSEELQMYYLNHTIIGPQYYLLKNIEKVIISIV